MPAPIVGRLAPSPTGLLHLGHARTFLVAWWHARSRGGSVLLRMEDLDRSRAREGLADRVLHDLEWLGLDWDGPVVRQSERTALYRDAIDALERAGLVYACTCTRKEIELAASAPHESDGSSRYPGTCRARFPSLAEAEARTGRPACMRLHVTDGEIAFVDELLGEQRVNVAQEVGDFPITSRDGMTAYQLAVVVDDHAQGVTEVVRGADLLSSCARQILVQRALSLPHPSWWHVPLVVDEHGQRLAKRTDALSLAGLRERGIDPRRIVSWAATASGMDVPALVRADECRRVFSVEHLPRTAIRLPSDPLALFPPPPSQPPSPSTPPLPPRP